MPSSDTIKTCTDCHETLLSEESVHPPAKKDCERCHQSNGIEHPLENVVGFALADEIPTLCYGCHDPKNEEEHVHPPIEEGKCMVCHSPHSTPNLYVLKEDPVSKLCFQCHDLDIPEGNMVHQAVTDGNCQGCHNPHQADNEKFLNSSRTSSLCRSCHRAQRSEARLDHVHPPFKEDCFKCHQPHTSKEAHLLEQKPKELCTSCHAEFVASMHKMPLLHGAVNEPESCLTCHSPHASKQPKIVKAEEREVCLNCHQTIIQGKERKIKNIGELVLDGNHVHGAIEQEGCTTCHNPHASEDHTLLAGNFPHGNYAAADTSNFELCFKCHDKNLFMEPLTTTVTNFRNNDQNLHFTHINGKKGRSCTLCHNVHGSRNDHLINETVAFGNWDMPIRYEKVENGGSCATGCHEKRSYERIILSDSISVEK